MNASPLVFAPRTFNVPTPKHASQTPEEIKQNFIAMLAGNRAALLAIKQAAAGQCVLVINPSRNPHANTVFGAVLNRMIAYHRAKMEEAAAATQPETPAEPATVDEQPPFDREPAPQPTAMVVEQPVELTAELTADEAEIEAAFAI